MITLKYVSKWRKICLQLFLSTDLLDRSQFLQPLEFDSRSRTYLRFCLETLPFSTISELWKPLNMIRYKILFKPTTQPRSLLTTVGSNSQPRAFIVDISLTTFSCSHLFFGSYRLKFDIKLVPHPYVLYDNQSTNQPPYTHTHTTYHIPQG